MGADSELVPAHAREFVRALLDHKIPFDYIDVYSDRTVRIGRYPDGYELPDPQLSASGPPPQPDLFARWKGRFR